MSDIIVDKQCTCLLDINTKQCLNCRSSGGNFTCHGCCQHFCPEHVQEHRAGLANNLQSLIVQNQRLDVSVGGGNRQLECQRARDQIDRWEQDSIRKVKESAEEVRRKLAKVCGESESSQTNQLVVCHDRLTARLQEARSRNNYHERHLKYWAEFIKDLQENFTRLRGGYVRLEPCGQLIEKLCIDEKTVGIRFSKWCEIKETCLQVVDVRRTGEYRDGNCTQPVFISACTDAPLRPRSPSPIPVPRSRTPSPIRPPAPRPRPPSPPPPSRKICPQELQRATYQFCIFDDHRFIGIISSQGGSVDSPPDTPGVYGWTISGDVYQDGVCQRGSNNDLRPGDVVELTLSSAENSIQLRNLTRSRTHELSVDRVACPLPWEVKVDRRLGNYQ